MAKRNNGNGYSLAELKDMITEGEGRLGKLHEREAKLSEELEGVRAEIATLGGPGGSNGAARPAKRGRPRGSSTGTGAKRGRRPRNEKNLPDTIADVLTSNGGPMPVADLTAAIQATGYTSNSANFRGIVNQALIKDDRFTATSRGVYGFAEGASA